MKLRKQVKLIQKSNLKKKAVYGMSGYLLFLFLDNRDPQEAPELSVEYSLSGNDAKPIESQLYFLLYQLKQTNKIQYNFLKQIAQTVVYIESNGLQFKDKIEYNAYVEKLKLLRVN